VTAVEHVWVRRSKRVVCARCGARLYGGCWIEPKEKETCQPKNG